MPIRTATPEDAACIGAIRVAAWQAAYRGAMPDAYLDALDPGANLEWLRAALGAEPAPFTLRVVEDDVAGQPVAFSIVGKPRYAVAGPASTMELWALNVHPLHWRRGAGQQLVQQALVDAQVQGFAAVELWCIHSNTAARRLYKACGFRASGAVRTTSHLTSHPLQEVAYRCAV
ncbi:N-acetyltransferase family protein [Acidovorax sp.]|uniref:GNAT family N-acetyltransferase n=1 Tax=Acidovorax sp. TaxID=1872122 RepID=UPI00391F6248